MNSYSYEEYSIILRLLQDYLPIMDYSEIEDNTERFVVIRHDVEFSVERAYRMAELEAELDVFSSYMFQIRNHAYNTFSSESINMIKKIYDMGHKIGLHVHLGMLMDIDKIDQYVIQDLKIMENMLKIPIDRFSFHRPPKEVLHRGLTLENYINTYDNKYFDFRKDDQGLDNVRIKYIADSMHRWKYGYPSKEILHQYSKIQLLIHPYSWTEIGFESKDNFKELVKDKEIILKNTLKNECNHYQE